MIIDIIISIIKPIFASNFEKHLNSHVEVINLPKKLNLHIKLMKYNTLLVTLPSNIVQTLYDNQTAL